jgi:hypothetical protein
MQEEECPAAEVMVGLNEVSGTCARCHLLKVRRGRRGGGREGEIAAFSVTAGRERGREGGEGAGERVQALRMDRYLAISNVAPLTVTLSVRSAAGRLFHVRGKLLLFFLRLNLLSMSHGPPAAGHLT